MVEKRVQLVLARIPVVEKKLLEGIYIEIRKNYLNHLYSDTFYLGMVNYSCDAILFRVLNTIFKEDPLRGLILNTTDEKYLKDPERILKLQKEYEEIKKSLNLNKEKYHNELLKIVSLIKDEAKKAN